MSLKLYYGGKTLYLSNILLKILSLKRFIHPEIL